MLTAQYAHAYPDIRINAVEPGITATELGGGEPGSHPGRPAVESAKVVARLATIGPDGPSGTFQETSASSAGGCARGSVAYAAVAVDAVAQRIGPALYDGPKPGPR